MGKFYERLVTGNLDDAYVTYKNEYIESVWWSLKSFLMQFNI